MNRREFLRRVSYVFTAIPALSLTRNVLAGPSNIAATELQFVLIQDTSESINRSFLAALRSLAHFKYSNWERGLKTLDLHKDKSEIDRLLAKYGPATTELNVPILVAIPGNGSVPEDIELWNQEWLSVQKASNTDVDPACYPRRNGSFWSVEGDWNPSREKVKRHLFQSPNHESGQFELQWLSSLSRTELQSIHSDHHDEMSTQRPTVHWSYVNHECPELK